MESLELEIQDDNISSIDALNTARQVRHLYLAIFINPLYVAGLVGNLLALIVFRKMARSSRRAARDAIHLLTAISAADALYLAFMFEYTWSSWGLPLLERKSDSACALLFYLRGVAGTSAVLLFTALSLSRLLILSRGPISTSEQISCHWLPSCLRRRAEDIFGLACLVSISASLLVNIPRIVGFRLNDSEDVPCRSHHESMVSTILHMSAHMLFQRLGPALLISFLNLFLLLRLRQCRRLCAAPTNANSDASSRLSNDNRRRLHRRQRRLTRACLVLGCGYVLFFVPPSIYWCCIYAWDISKRIPLSSLQFHAIIGDMASVTATLSSAINFPVYLACLKDFRAVTRRLFCRRAAGAAPTMSTPTSEISETGGSLELQTVVNGEAGNAA